MITRESRDDLVDPRDECEIPPWTRAARAILMMGGERVSKRAQGDAGCRSGCDVNVVIVDREPAARAALVELCSRTEDVHVVGHAATGAKAIEAAQVLGPDLMLVDAELPDMTGLEVLRAVHAGRRRRTILITANNHDSATAYAAGAMDCLTKPVNPAAFRVSIERARAAVSRSPGRIALSTAPSTREHAARDNDRPLFLIGERERRLELRDIAIARESFFVKANNFVLWIGGRVGDGTYSQLPFAEAHMYVGGIVAVLVLHEV